MVVDRLTKMVHFIPTRKTAGAQELARLFFDNIVRLHGVPDAIISDRDTCFTSDFWRALFEATQTKLKFSTAYHPQTDGQTERANRTLLQYLRCYASPSGADWDLHLSAAEFAYNSTKQSSTQLAPFLLNYGRHPRSPLDSLVLRHEQLPLHTSDSATALTRQLEELHSRAKRHLQNAQQHQSAVADQHRSATPVYALGDQVLVRFRNTTSKLQRRWHGPFTVISLPSPNVVQVELTEEFSGFENMINVQDVKLAEFDVHDRSTRLPDLVVEHVIDEQRIVRPRKRGPRPTRFLVTFTGRPLSEAAWLAPNKSYARSVAVYRRQLISEPAMLEDLLAKAIAAGVPAKPSAR